MNKDKIIGILLLVFCWANIHIRTNCGKGLFGGGGGNIAVGVGTFPITDQVLMFYNDSIKFVPVERFFTATALTCE